MKYVYIVWEKDLTLGEESQSIVAIYERLDNARSVKQVLIDRCIDEWVNYIIEKKELL